MAWSGCGCAAISAVSFVLQVQRTVRRIANTVIEKDRPGAYHSSGLSLFLYQFQILCRNCPTRPVPGEVCISVIDAGNIAFDIVVFLPIYADNVIDNLTSYIPTDNVHMVILFEAGLGVASLI